MTKEERDPLEILIMRYREDLSRMERKIDKLTLIVDERTSDTRPIFVSLIKRIDRIESILAKAILEAAE
ncbi:MAG: hypothetical protein J2P41_00150 [Blastocatellia bacterium]|nr:hypothetical protein [Blastocatellia bacterium]